MYSVMRNDAKFVSEIDRILERICQKLQLSTTQFKLAEQHYKAVGEWLEGEGSEIAIYRPKIYPQGSLPMGVTNKPVFKDEYDLDFICELFLLSHRIHPNDLFARFEYRIGQNRDYAARMERGNRCIKLKYAHDFHLDIVPACSNASAGDGQVKIPDREKKNWKDTNSSAYVQWFNDIADMDYRTLVYGRADHAEPLKPQESLEEKSPLKCAIQIIKRHRDIAFEDKSDLAPASIVLSTLGAEAYKEINGMVLRSSVFEVVALILHSISRRIASCHGAILEVWNPVNLVPEDLGERWKNNPSAYFEFTQWIADFSIRWNELRMTRGPQLAVLLKAMFDENLTTEALREDTLEYGESRELGKLWIKPAGTLTTSSTPVRLPPNTFYGK
jgi:hypothetical protein